MVFLHSKAVVKGEVSSPRETDIVEVDTRGLVESFGSPARVTPKNGRSHSEIVLANYEYPTLSAKSEVLTTGQIIN